MTPYIKKGIKPRVCVICNETFTPLWPKHSAKTCSSECQRKNIRHIQRINYFHRLKKDAPPQKPEVKLTEAQKGYIAGILDGEGHLGIMKRKRDWKDSDRPHFHRPIVQVCQAKRPVLDYLMDLLGHRDMTTERHTGIMNLRLHPPCLRWLLPSILPHLVLKHRQAEILIEFMDSCRYQGKTLSDTEWEHREQLRREMSHLNLRGSQNPLHIP